MQSTLRRELLEGDSITKSGDNIIDIGILTTSLRHASLLLPSFITFSACPSTLSPSFMTLESSLLFPLQMFFLDIFHLDQPRLNIIVRMLITFCTAFSPEAIINFEQGPTEQLIRCFNLADLARLRD